MKEEVKVLIFDIGIMFLVFMANGIENICLKAAVVWILVAIMIVLPKFLFKNNTKIKKISTMEKIMLICLVAVGVITGVAGALKVCGTGF